MTIETVVLPQDLFGYGCRDIYNISGGSTGPWIEGFNSSPGGHEAFNKETLNLAVCESSFYANHCNSSKTSNNVKEWDTNSSSQEGYNFPRQEEVPAPKTTTGRRKRKRSRSVKNQEEVEHQRMTHITVERNRRKKMNDYLSALRSMMPASYVQRGDQASIVGGAINFVKELEQLLQCLEAHKRSNNQSTEMGSSSSSSSSSSSLFSYFFTFPQYSTCSTNTADDDDQSITKKQSVAIKADVEVTMVERHANLKILIRRHPKQLLKMVDGLYSLCLSILHINVTTTVDHMVLYSFSVKAEEECQLTSVNEIAAAVYEMVDRMQEEISSVC